MRKPTLTEILSNPFSMTKLSNLRTIFPEFCETLLNKYPGDLSFSEKLYWYFYQVESHPICECGRRVSYRSFVKGYSSFCCLKCSRNSVITQEKLKQTNLERYGVEYNSQAQTSKDKMKITNLKRYGNACSLWNDTVQGKSLKTKTTKYGNPHFTNHRKAQATKLKKYGDPDFTNPKKGYETRKRNSSYNSSSIELNLKKWLDDHNISYQYQYKSKEYPFYCDFYFPDTNSYLEIQGNWTHGFHAYDPTSIEDLQKLNLWKNKNTKYYRTAVEVWSIKDPQKRHVARTNSLKWYEIFSINLEEILKFAQGNHIFNVESEQLSYALEVIE